MTRMTLAIIFALALAAAGSVYAGTYCWEFCVPHGGCTWTCIPT